MMAQQISNNYIITALLVAKDRLGIKEKYITFAEFDLFSKYIEDEFASRGIMTINFGDGPENEYFRYEQDDMKIYLNESSNLGFENIKNRYMAYLSFDVLEVLYGKSSLEYALKSIISAKELQIAELTNEINTLKEKDISKLNYYKESSFTRSRRLFNK